VDHDDPPTADPRDAVGQRTAEVIEPSVRVRQPEITRRRMRVSTPHPCVRGIVFHSMPPYDLL
jgi:hypothetical protein